MLMLLAVETPKEQVLVMLNHKEAQPLEQESETLMHKEVAMPLVLALAMHNHKEAQLLEQELETLSVKVVTLLELELAMLNHQVVSQILLMPKVLEVP
jgi:exonuclease I